MAFIEALALGAACGIIGIVVVLIRRGRLMERYALLWLTAGVVLAVLSLWRGLLDRAAHAIGIFYAPALLFIAGFAFVILILLHVSVVISKLSKSRSSLAQELALLKFEVEKLREESTKSE